MLDISVNGNAVEQDFTTFLSLSHDRRSKTNEDINVCDFDSQICDPISDTQMSFVEDVSSYLCDSSSCILSDCAFCNASISYIGGFIVKGTISKVSCQFCRCALISNVHDSNDSLPLIV